MAAPTRPAGVKSFAQTRLVFAPTMSAPGTPSLASDINGASSLDLTGLGYLDDFTWPTAETTTGQAPMRIMDTTQYGAVGTATYNGGTVKWTYAPQSATTGTAYAKFPVGTTGYLIVRGGKSASADFATGDIVWVYPVQFGEQSEGQAGDGQFAEFCIDQTYVVTGPPNKHVTVAA